MECYRIVDDSNDDDDVVVFQSPEDDEDEKDECGNIEAKCGSTKKEEREEHALDVWETSISRTFSRCWQDFVRETLRRRHERELVKTPARVRSGERRGTLRARRVSLSRLCSP